MNNENDNNSNNAINTNNKADPAVGGREGTRPDVARTSLLGKGRMGSALMGSLQMSCFSTGGLLGHSS